MSLEGRNRKALFFWPKKLTPDKEEETGQVSGAGERVT